MSVSSSRGGNGIGEFQLYSSTVDLVAHVGSSTGNELVKSGRLVPSAGDVRIVNTVERVGELAPEDRSSCCRCDGGDVLILQGGVKSRGERCRMVLSGHAHDTWNAVDGTSVFALFVVVVCVVFVVFGTQKGFLDWLCVKQPSVVMP